MLSVHKKVINLKAGDELLALALPQAGGSSRFLCLNALPDVAEGDIIEFSQGTPADGLGQRLCT